MCCADSFSSCRMRSIMRSSLSRAASPPLESFSEGMLCTVGLPTHVYSRLTQWFSRATDEGILEELAVVPPDVLAADPGAQRAWCWLLKLMREQVLGSVLQAEREKVESSVLELRAYHAPRRSTRMLVSAAERRRASMRGSVGSLGSSVGSLGSAGSWGSSAEGGGSPSERALCAELERERERCAMLE